MELCGGERRHGRNVDSLQRFVDVVQLATTGNGWYTLLAARDTELEITVG